MKTYSIVHKGIDYSFEYMENSKVIVVVKGDIPTYEIKVLNSAGTVTFECNCPGSVWRGHCWHVDGDHKNTEPSYGGPWDILERESLPNEPWVEWAEEAAMMQKEKHL